MSTCNNTLLDAPLVEEDIYGSITFFDLSIYLASVFTVVASCLSGYLIFRHATNYTKPGEQKQILRILFMIPIYSITATLSIKYYHAHVYLEATHLFYEALVLAAFFMLLCSYLAPTMEELREKLLLVKPRPWAPPLSWMPKKSRGEKGWFRTPRSGLTLFMIIWIFVFQYCIVKALLTFITFITEATETYCATSNSIKFAHIWVTQIQGQSLGFAMFCLLQLYLQFKSELEKHSPFLKFLAIKIVVFLTLFQSSAFTFLAAPEDAILKPTAKISYISWNIAVPNLLLCFEMAAAALLHLWAYPWRQYAQTSAEISDNYATLRKQGGFKAVCDALNYWDFVKAIGSGFYWLRVERKSRDDYGAPEGGVDEITLKGKEIEDDL